MARRARAPAAASRRGGDEASPAAPRDPSGAERQLPGLLVGEHVLPEGGAEARQPLAGSPSAASRSRALEPGARRARTCGGRARARGPARRSGRARPGAPSARRPGRRAPRSSSSRRGAPRAAGSARAAAPRSRRWCAAPARLKNTAATRSSAPLGPLHRLDGVGEARARAGSAAMASILRPRLGQRRLEGRGEVAVADRAERRQAERRGPVLEQRVHAGPSGQASRGRTLGRSERGAVKTPRRQRSSSRRRARRPARSPGSTRRWSAGP